MSNWSEGRYQDMYADPPEPDDWKQPARPFVKMVGGKRQLLSELQKYIPRFFKRYYEPFVGGGALFFHLKNYMPDCLAVIGDNNPYLIRAYIGVRDYPNDVIAYLKSMTYSADEYYERRQNMPKLRSAKSSEIAAWFIYMNKCGYNGLWRVNRTGQFNVPFGRYINPTICDEENLHACFKALWGTVIMYGDFEKTVESAAEEDLVYFDCPYWPASDTANFTGYTSNGFQVADQIRLRDAAIQLKKRNVHVILSNADVPEVHALYTIDGIFDIHQVKANRAINSNASKRGAVGELIIT